MQSDTTAARVIGRPREARADRAILAAALDLMAERGVHELRMDDVAARAGVGKAAIYRRYRSKDALVADAVAALVSEITVPDTGSTRGDLLALMRDAVEVYTGSVAARAMPSLVETMSRNAELAEAVRDRFLAGRRAALREVLGRGIERRDLAADLDLEFALDVLAGPLFYRLLITGGPIDQELAEGVADLMMRGFAPKERPRQKSQKAGKEKAL